MLSDPRDRLIPALDGVTEVRPGVWQARCPAHDDRNPSLSVKEVDGGKLLIHCHSGCSFDQVVSAVGLQPSDLFPRDDYIQYVRYTGMRNRSYRAVVENARGAATIMAVYADEIKKHWDEISPVLDLDEKDKEIFLGVTQDLRELLRD